jgi:RNA polymerase sigma factor (sigma-70 family)
VPTEIEQLYREHRAGLVRLVERELRDHHDAEDVVQTAFLDAQRALERGTIPRNPRAWLAAIALNAGRRLRRRRLNAEPLEEYAAHEAAGMPEIRAALASLPREQRTAVMYRDLLGLSYGETAEQMGTSVNAVTMLLHRGRRRLRQALGLTAGGIGVWRWLKRAGMPQMAVAKGAAAVVVTAGLATSGVVAARAIAPAAAAAPPTRPGTTAEVRMRTPHGAVAQESARRQLRSAHGSKASAVPAATTGSGGDATPASVPASTAETVAAVSRSTLPVPAVSVPALPVSTPAVTVAVSTPVATVTVSTPASTTVAVTTPIATVTVPIP